MKGMAESSPLLAVYTRRHDARQQEARRWEQQVRTISWFRLAVALAGVGLAFAVFGPRTVALGWLGVPVAVFLALAVAHERALQRQRRALRTVAFYSRGLARLEDRWAGTGQPGERFRDAHHPYADDLDVFGRGSLFELLCTARTALGEDRLASWLRAPATVDEVRARQEAIRELTPLTDLREELAVLGDDLRSDLHAPQLAEWAAAPPAPLPAWARWVAPALVVLTLTALALAALNAVPLSVALLAIALQMGFAGWLRPGVLEIVGHAHRPGRDLALLAHVLGRLERERFSAAKLVALRAALDTHGLPPSRQVARLDQRITLLDARLNQFFIPIGWLLLWTTQCALAVERWRRENGPGVGRWLDAVAEWEALLSLAAYAAEHPDDPFPELRGEDGFGAEGIAHPLLPVSRAVRNDVALGGPRRLLVVSGSNMSGKSTLMRAIGLNVVLALAGAPVRARRLALSPLAVATSLRVQDSLQEGASRFYAEITRLRQVVEIAQGPLPALFLLDEILSGTNSHDRRIGAEAVVRGLVERGAIGLVTTHDLALAQIADSLGARAANVHFEDHIENGEVRFDYLMRPGVVTRSNALELMRSVGLEV